MVFCHEVLESASIFAKANRQQFMNEYEYNKVMAAFKNNNRDFRHISHGLIKYLVQSVHFTTL